MFNIIFPQKKYQRYWKSHYLYVLNILNYLNCTITFEEREDFILTINGKDFLIDFWDTDQVRKSDLPTFKFHCSEETDQVYAFPPISFYDWDQYYQLEKEIQYNPLHNWLISCRQRPYGNAEQRRQFVQGLLTKNKNLVVLTKIIDQVTYWKEISEIDCAVFVPGQHNNMLDRAHLQYLAFGCYTISPKLPEKLPFGGSFDSGVHYDFCKDDYSDLIYLIELMDPNYNVDYLLDTGEWAKNMFQNTCTPEAIGRWIETKL